VSLEGIGGYFLDGARLTGACRKDSKRSSSAVLSPGTGMGGEFSWVSMWELVTSGGG